MLFSLPQFLQIRMHSKIHLLISNDLFRMMLEVDAVNLWVEESKISILIEVLRLD